MSSYLLKWSDTWGQHSRLVVKAWSMLSFIRVGSPGQNSSVLSAWTISTILTYLTTCKSLKHVIRTTTLTLYCHLSQSDTPCSFHKPYCLWSLITRWGITLTYIINIIQLVIIYMDFSFCPQFPNDKTKVSARESLSTLTKPSDVVEVCENIQQYVKS